MKVYCVLRSGGRYDFNWVERLERGVRRFWPSHLDTLQFRQIVDQGGPGWWSKLELFDRVATYDADTAGLYFDLDNVITAPLARLVEFVRALPRDGFGVMRDPFRNDGGFQSAVMAWGPDFGKRAAAIYKAAYDIGLDELQRRYAHCGDQGFVEEYFMDSGWEFSRIPRSIVGSFKVNWSVGAKSDVVQFHGEPKPDQIDPEHELAKLWRA